VKHKTVERETKTVHVHVEQGLALCQVANGEHIFHVTAAEVPQSLSKKRLRYPPCWEKNYTSRGVYRLQHEGFNPLTLQSTHRLVCMQLRQAIDNDHLQHFTSTLHIHRVTVT